VLSRRAGSRLKFWVAIRYAYIVLEICVGKVLEAVRLARSLSRVQGTSSSRALRPCCRFGPEEVRRRLSARGRSPGEARFLQAISAESPAPEALPDLPDRFRNAL